MREPSLDFALNKETNNHIASAWERFTDSGDIDSVKVRPIISRSWINSRNLGIRPETESAPTVITKDELEENIQNSDLGCAGVPVLNKLSDILHDTKHVVVLADAKGRILYSIGHKQIQDQLENINFRPGGSWAEKAVGPNGIGTPLELKRPEVVMGYEHYCKGWHPWVCYGAPIFDDTDRKVNGMIDITGPVDKVNREAMALSMSVAQSVNSGIFVIKLRRRELLRELSKNILCRYPGDIVIVIDKEGHIVDFNSRAIEYLNLNSDYLVEKNIEQLLPNLSGTIKDSINNQSEVELDIHTSNSNKLIHSNKIRLIPIINDNKCIGLTLLVTGFKKFEKSNVNNRLQNVGDELIKQTLKETNNNISAAARILGIDRTTIYRRRRKW